MGSSEVMVHTEQGCDFPGIGLSSSRRRQWLYSRERSGGKLLLSCMPIPWLHAFCFSCLVFLLAVQHSLNHACFLQVESTLHRAQLIRALKRVILGLGKTASIPQVCLAKLAARKSWKRFPGVTLVCLPQGRDLKHFGLNFANFLSSRWVLPLLNHPFHTSLYTQTLRCCVLPAAHRDTINPSVALVTHLLCCVQAFTAKPVSCSSIALSWQPPERHGHPPLHKYKLERQQVTEASEASPWITAHGDLDDEDTSFLDEHLEPGQYRYRSVRPSLCFRSC